MTETLYPHEWLWQNFGEIVVSIGVAGIVFYCGVIVVVCLTYEPSGTLDAVSIYNHPTPYHGNLAPILPILIGALVLIGLAYGVRILVDHQISRLR